MRYTTALLAGLLLYTPSSAQVTFVNGGFESGDFTGWTVGVTSGGATAVQQVITFDIDGTAGPLGDSLSAQFSAGRATGVTTGEHGVTLTQLLTLQAGTQYTFDFDWAATRFAGTTANAQGGIFALMVDTTEITRQAAGSTGPTTPHYGHITGGFTPAVTGDYAVGVWILRPFTVPAPPTLLQNVDNFVVSAVPEPSSMALVAVGALVAVKRWRRKGCKS